MKLSVYGNQPIMTPRDPMVPMEAANKNYVDNTVTAHESDMTKHLTPEQNVFIDNITVGYTDVNQLTGISGNVQTQLDSKLNLTGGVLTGTLTLAGAPSSALHAATKLYVDNQDAAKVSKAGDTMTGDLTLSGDPSSALHATPKRYVDSTVATHANDQTLHLTASQNALLDAISVTATEVNQVTGVTGNIQGQLDTKLPKSGGTLTGDLVLNSDPIANLQAATKQYVDNKDGLKVSKTGDTMTGSLVLHADPTEALEAAPKQYVDATVSGHANDASLHLTTAQNALLDAVTVTATEINELVGVTANVQTQLNSKLPKSGGTLTGDLILNSDPTTVLQAATKQYVDAADVLAVKKAGDTMTGALTLSGNPVGNLEATPKQYVDEVVTTHVNDATKHLTADQNTFLDAITVTATEVNDLAGLTGNVQTQLNSKFDKTGGTISGNIQMLPGSKIILTGTPVTNNEVVNKSYVDSLVKGQEWKNPVTDINVVDINANDPPASPVDNDVYIIGANPTGAWIGKAGYATYYSAGAWVYLQGRPVDVGDRFGVKLTTTTAAAGNVSAFAGRIIEIKVATIGALGIAGDNITPGSTTLVFDPQSSKFGISYTYTDEGIWVPTNTSVNLTAGAGLSLAGNTLNFNAGNGLGFNGDIVDIKLDTASGIGFDANNSVTLHLDGTTITATEAGVKVNDTVIAAINDKTSKTGTNNVSGSFAFDVNSSLKTEFTPLTADDVVNKGYVDTADNAIKTELTNVHNVVNSLNADPVTKTYVDNADATKLPLAGGTLTGALTLSAAPTATLQAATKGYVDSTVTTHAEDFALHLTAAQNALIDSITVTAVEINKLAGVTANVQTQIDSKLNLSGGTLTGAIVLHSDPVNALEPTTKQYVDGANDLAVKIAGSTMTGALILVGDPSTGLQATPKQYVDTNLAAHADDATKHLTSAQNTFLDNLSITYQEANQLAGVTSAVQTQLNSKVNKAGDTMTGTLVLHADPANDLEAATKQYVDTADALAVKKTGDTMTGALTLSGAPTTSLQAANKGYVDTNIASHANNDTLHITASQNTLLDGITVTFEEVNHLAGSTSNIQTQLDSKLNLTGGTLTGALTLSADPASNLQAATKQYVDSKDSDKVSKAGDTMTGALVLPADPINALEASTKQYVDSKDSAQKTYIDNQDATKVSKSGSTMTGTLVLAADPINDLEAATKQYVDLKDSTQKSYIDTNDAALSTRLTSVETTVGTLNTDPVTKFYVDSADATKLPIAGGTMTGYITLHSNPQQSMHPATKMYVDAIAQGLSTKPSVRFATTANLAGVYDNGDFGVNSTLTGTVNGALVVDGGSPIVNDRILVKDQTNRSENGDYVVQQIGNASTPFILKRVSTIDESNEVPGSYFYVYDGATLKGTGWVFTVVNPVTFTIGTDDIFVNQFSGQGSLTAGNGLTMTGNTVQINTVNPSRIVVNADNIDLATTGIAPGSYTKVTLDGYGRATSGENPNTLDGYGITDGQKLNANLTSVSNLISTGIVVRDTTNEFVTKSMDVSGVGLTITNKTGANSGDIVITSNATSSPTANTVVSRDDNGNFSANVITASLAGNADTATILSTSRKFSVTGDATSAEVGFNGSGNVVLDVTLKNSGVVAGSFTKLDVNAKGLVTGGYNPTAIADLGVTDVYDKTTVDQMLSDMDKKFEELYLYVMSRT